MIKIKVILMINNGNNDGDNGDTDGKLMTIIGESIKPHQTIIYILMNANKQFILHNHRRPYVNYQMIATTNLSLCHQLSLTCHDEYRYFRFHIISIVAVH